MFKMIPVVLFLLTWGLSAQASLITETNTGPQFIKYLVESKAVADNKIGNVTQLALHVVLPLDYKTSNLRYPVVYFLHGHGDTPQGVRNWLALLNKAFEGRQGFILVGVEGKNKLQGGFYANSPLTGRWEDWLVKETVPFIDATLRTIPKAESRGLFGFSMGGFGVLYNGLRHPDIFSCVFATGPGVIHPEGGMEAAFNSWEGSENFISGYGGAFAGSLDLRPEFSGTKEDNLLVEKWASGFGQWDKKIDSYLAQKIRLKAVALEWGSRDSYSWIIEGSKWLAGYLPSRGIPVQSQEFIGGHQILPARISQSMIPFFLKNLSFQ